MVAKAVSKKSKGRLPFSVMRNSSTILGEIKNNNSAVEASWIVLQVNYSLVWKKLCEKGNRPPILKLFV